MDHPAIAHPRGCEVQVHQLSELTYRAQASVGHRVEQPESVFKCRR